MKKVSIYCIFNGNISKSHQKNTKIEKVGEILVDIIVAHGV